MPTFIQIAATDIFSMFQSNIDTRVDCVIQHTCDELFQIHPEIFSDLSDTRHANGTKRAIKGENRFIISQWSIYMSFKSEWRSWH